MVSSPFVSQLRNSHQEVGIGDLRITINRTQKCIIKTHYLFDIDKDISLTFSLKPTPLVEIYSIRGRVGNQPSPTYLFRNMKADKSASHKA